MKRELSPWGRQCKVQMVVLDKNLSALSQETNLSRSYISAIINGRIVVPDETIQAISRALEVDVALAR